MVLLAELVCRVIAGISAPGCEQALVRGMAIPWDRSVVLRLAPLSLSGSASGRGAFYEVRLVYLVAC